MGNPITERGPKVRVIASTSTWIEGESLRQLDAAAELQGMRQVVGMPDLHPGKGGPVGAAFLSEGFIHPTLVGSDIGCGMTLCSLDIPARKARPDRIAERLNGLDRPWAEDTSAFLEQWGVQPTAHDASLGTPGHGNHFLEVQRIREIRDPGIAERHDLDLERLCLLVHSGSRGLGEAVLRGVTAERGGAPLLVGTPEADAYLAAHDHAVRWAAVNRILCCHRVGAALGAETGQRLDVCHNSVVAHDDGACRCWLHRKGAAPADMGPVVIPGSRGEVSYLVVPRGPRVDQAATLWSLAHGAGRKLARHEAKAKLRGRYRREDLQRNRFGGRVVCGEELLLWEEAPEAYKDIHSVVSDLVEAGACDVAAILEPLVTFKTSEGARDERQRGRPDWKQERRQARNAKRAGEGER